MGLFWQVQRDLLASNHNRRFSGKEWDQCQIKKRKTATISSYARDGKNGEFAICFGDEHKLKLNKRMSWKEAYSCD